MPLIHIQDLETMAEHLRVNIITYMLQNHNIEALNDNAERDMYNFIFLTIQNYVLNPPESIQNKKKQSLLCLFTKGIGFYAAFAFAIITLYCLRVIIGATV